MALRVSTVSSDVDLDDLGIRLTHPTNNYSLTDNFTAREIADSTDLANAIAAGLLDLDDGTNFIHKDDYVPQEVVLQEIGIRIDENFVSNDELEAGFLTTHVYDAVFPIGVNSTAAVTRNVYCPAARFVTWMVEPGDFITINGNAAAGTYVVESITDQQNLIVVSPIVDSTGGDVEIFHPAASTRIGIDPTGISWTSATNLQAALEDLDPTGSGLDEVEHRELDQLVHDIAEDSYEEITYSGIYPTTVVVWTDSGKTTKIREELYSYTGTLIDSATYIQYNASGIEVERMTETYNRTGFKITSIDRELI